jgi:flagellar hook-associated protein 2
MTYSPMRIGGLASGMDIDQIVSDLMKAERMRVDKLYQQKQILEWQKADFRNINLKLRTLYNHTFDMRLQSNYLRYNTVSTLSDSSPSDVFFSASAGSSAIPATYSFRVEQLAKSAEMKSDTSISRGLVGKGLTDVEITASNSNFDITIDGVKRTISLDPNTYTIDGSSGYTLEDLAADIQVKIDSLYGDGRLTVSLEEVSGGEQKRLIISPSGDHKFLVVLNSSDQNDALHALGFADGSRSIISLGSPLRDEAQGFRVNPFKHEVGHKISFKINDKQFTFDLSEGGQHANYGLGDILSEISSDEDVNVRAYYDNVTDKIVFVSKEMGKTARIKVEDIEGNFLDALGMETGLTVTGENAKVIFDGTVVEKSSNSFILNGIQFTLKEEMSADEQALIKVENDPDQVVETIKNYLQIYNETVEEINRKLAEERFRDYLPLTETQKKEMSEKEIELWEERAKSGFLRSDSMLSGLISKMRIAVYTPIDGLPSDMNSLVSLGITTGSYTEQGKLYLNEAKLREALAKDADAVMRIFNSSGTGSDDSGVAIRLYDILKSGMEQITEKAGGGEFQKYDNSILAKQIKDMEERITDFEERLIRTEERYWRQFTEMEKAINYMNQQSMWLATQLGLYSGQ